MKAARPRPPRPTPEDLAAARDTLLPDVAAPGLRVLFSGINPGLYSAATGHHFARPGNRFWPGLHRSGFTPRLLRPDEQEQLLDIGLGITNIVARATARADELGPGELREGGRELAAKVGRLSPRWLAIVGVTAYRTAFGRPGRPGGTAGPYPRPHPRMGAAQPERAQRPLDSGNPGRRVCPAPGRGRGRRTGRDITTALVSRGAVDRRE